MEKDIDEINKSLDNISENLTSIGNTIDSLINKLDQMATKSDFAETTAEIMLMLKDNPTNVHMKCSKMRGSKKLILQLSIGIIGCIALVAVTKLWWR